MSTYHCSSCGYTRTGGPANIVGKRAKCPKCKTINAVLSDEDAAKTVETKVAETLEANKPKVVATKLEMPTVNKIDPATAKKAVTGWLDKVSMPKLKITSLRSKIPAFSIKKSFAAHRIAYISGLASIVLLPAAAAMVSMLMSDSNAEAQANREIKKGEAPGFASTPAPEPNAVLSLKSSEPSPGGFEFDLNIDLDDFRPDYKPLSDVSDYIFYGSIGFYHAMRDSGEVIDRDGNQLDINADLREAYADRVAGLRRHYQPKHYANIGKSFIDNRGNTLLDNFYVDGHTQYPKGWYKTAYTNAIAAIEQAPKCIADASQLVERKSTGDKWSRQCSLFNTKLTKVITNLDGFSKSGKNSPVIASKEDYHQVMSDIGVDADVLSDALHELVRLHIALREFDKANGSEYSEGNQSLSMTSQAILDRLIDMYL